MKQIVLIEANRECYGPDQIRGTLTVGQLIDLLGDYDEDTPIAISNDNGYTYGSIDWSDIREEEIENEEEEEEE